MSRDLFLAAKTGNLLWLEQCFKKYPDPNGFNMEGMAPIHIAASACELGSLATLIDKYGADVNKTSIDGLNSLHFAFTSRNRKKVLKVVAYLLKKGIDVNCPTPNNWTPLHLAAYEGLFNSIELLLLKNADINAKDTAGLYPHEIAKIYGHKKCHRLLYQAFWASKKDSILLQKSQLRKVVAAYNNLLKDALEQLAAEQDFFGNLTHNNWLESKGIHDSNVKRKLQHFDRACQPLIRMDGLQKKLANGGDEMKKFVDCSARVESLSLKYKKQKETSTRESTKKICDKKNTPMQKLKKRSSNSRDSRENSMSFDSVEFVPNTHAASHIENAVAEPVPKYLEMFVKVDYSKNKPVALRVSLPGRNDQPITEFPDIPESDVKNALKGTKDKIYRNIDFDSILGVQHKRIFPPIVNDTFKHLKHASPLPNVLSPSPLSSTSIDSTSRSSGSTSSWSHSTSSGSILV